MGMRAVADPTTGKVLKRTVLPGDEFGLFTIVCEVDALQCAKGTKRRFLCRCQCGREKIVCLGNLTSGNSKTCGSCVAAVSRSRGRKLPDGEVNRNSCYQNYRTHANARGLAFELSLEDFAIITSQICHYCGSPPANRFFLRYKGKPRYETPYIYNGIDRVNSDIGYALDNTVPCCAVCNRAKSDLPSDTFYKWLNQLVIFRIHQEHTHV